MSADLVETLPLPARLALSYAPARSREAVLTLLLLDRRLADIVARRGEPAIAQLKLAWWRDRLGGDPADWPEGEPLLARLREWPGEPRSLVPLVNGWERLLGERLDAAALEEYAHGRAAGWLAIAPDDGVAATARQWALADLAMHMEPGEERDGVEAHLRGISVKPGLPRAVRPLVVLHALTMRALARGSGDLLDGPGAALLALRTGLLGR